MRVESLSSRHDRTLFDCGKETLNEYLRLYALQNERKDNARTFVLLPVEGERVIGYYTTLVKSLEAEVVPEKEKMRGFPMPVALIARLAVDSSFQGQGFGGKLLVDALRRVGRAASEIGIRAVEVDAMDEEARAFYERFGFQPLLDDPLHLYLPLKILLKTPLTGGRPEQADAG